MRYTSQSNIRPKDRISVYPSNYSKIGKENHQFEDERPKSKLLLNLKTYMTEEEKEGLYKAFDSDEEQPESSDKYIGEQAIFDYYDKYKKFSRDSQKFTKTPIINYLEKIHFYNVPPTPSGLIKRSGSEKNMNVKNFNLSKPYVSALSSSMKDMNIKSLTLSTINNNEEGITEVFANLCPGVEKLDCSNSSIGELSLFKLCSYMRNGFRQNTLNLKLINLSNNKINDEVAANFFDQIKLIENDIEELDLSRNLLSDNATKSLSNFMEHSYTIKTLNLSWNNIGARGGIALFYGIYKGRTLKNLNFSYNCLGRGNCIELIEILIEAINEETLRHLDLSFNNIHYLLCK